MRTTTRGRILGIIEKGGPARPHDLVKRLGLSNQAIHRHLQSLVAHGVLETHGAPPVTRYGLAGIPDLAAAGRWFAAARAKEPPSDTVCETRDRFSARLSAFKALTKQGLAAEDLPLVVSVVGEIGNNSFDHNIGQWRDIPGCWFEIQVRSRTLFTCIADRGQGVHASLGRVIPNIPDDQAALEMAFEQQVSGRSPEQRGNGLKFVKNVILGARGRGVACVSGTGRIRYGERGETCLKILDRDPPRSPGTLTLVAWELGAAK